MGVIPDFFSASVNQFVDLRIATKNDGYGMRLESSGLLKNKTVLVIGATSLMGWRISLACAAQGAMVIAVSRESSQLNALREELQRVGDRQHSVVEFDLLASEKINSLVEHLILKNGVIHHFVHAPGLATPCRLLDTKPQMLERLFRVNVVSAFEFVRALSAHPKRPNLASGIFVSPVSNSDSPQGMSAYALCRGAIISSMRIMSEELKPEHVRLNCLIPGLRRCDGHPSASVGQINALRQGMDFDASNMRMADNAVTMLTDQYEAINGELVMFDNDGKPNIMSLESLPVHPAGCAKTSKSDTAPIVTDLAGFSI